VPLIFLHLTQSMSPTFGWCPIAFEQEVELLPEFRCTVGLLFLGKEQYVTLQRLLYFCKQRTESQATHLLLRSVEMLNTGFHRVAICGKVSGVNCR
jgi:hypothetical protein